jgi:hypothetical protein
MRMVGILKTAAERLRDSCSAEEGGWDNDWIKRYCWIE